jgi:hypothetical protein
LAFEATLLGKLGATERALGASLLGSFRAAAALLGGFCAAALLPEAATCESAACLAPATFAPLLGGFCAATPLPEAATFDSAACLAPATFAASFGIALNFMTTAALLFGIALAAARAIAGLPAGVVAFEREAAMLSG